MAMVAPAAHDLASSYPRSASADQTSHHQIRALPPLPQATARRQGSAGTSTNSFGSSLGAGASYGGGGRLLPTPTPMRSPSAPPFLDTPSRSLSSPASTPSLSNSLTTTASSSPSQSSPATSSRPSPTPSPAASTPSSTPNHSHSHSSSSSSLPRLPPVHLATGLSSAPPVSNYGQQQHHQQFNGYPSFPQGSFAGGAGGGGPQQGHPFPHPQFPFLPSPHPHAGLGSQYPGPGPYSPGFAQNGGDPQHQARLLQQAQFQQQQWQMEMMRNGQAMYDWQAANGAPNRRRATSGPAPPSHSPQFYTTPLPYPPSPAPSFSQQIYPGQGPSLPPGAMLAQYGVHGYPTPPGSVEGGRLESASGREGFHPYRRNKTDSPDRSTKNVTAQPPQSTTPITKPGRVPPPSISGYHTPNSSTSSTASHARNESASSLSMQNFPPLPKSSAPSPAPSPVYSGAQHSAKNSTSSVASASGRSSPRSTPPPPRQKTESQTSSDSSFRPGAAERERKPSIDSTKSDGSQYARSSTPTSVATVGKRPSPLSQQVASQSPTSTMERPSTPATVKGRTSMADDGEDSDGTAEASTIAPSIATPVKEKKGMKSKFKRAFSMSSGPALTEAEIEGKGAKGALQKARRLSTSSSESSPPRTPPSGHESHPSVASASTSGTSRPPSSGRRFGMLNPKLNSSTDNISISSTVSSASMMIRKLGSMGKLARRNSLMGLTKAFKSKDKDKEEGEEKVSKKDKKKGALATTSVSHATVEVESGSSNGISPAAALAKKHQQLYAEQEAAAAAAAAKDALAPPRSFVVHQRTDSNASDASSVRSGWARSKTTDDVPGGKNRMLEKEREKLKSRKGRKWGLSFGGKADSDNSSLADTASISGSVREDNGYRVEPLSTQPNGQAYPAYGGSYFDDDTVEYASPTPAFADDDYEPSLRNSPPITRRDPKTLKGILKGAGTYNQENFSSRPAAARPRANSFDAPHQQGRPGSPGNAALVGKIPSEAQVDGLAPSSTSVRTDTHPPSPPAEHQHPSPYANPGLNNSAPALNSFGSQHAAAGAAPGGSGANIAFAANLSVHTTWPASVYDRRPEPATSNRLTPTLAQQIKEELNFFKMEEMDVHPQSRHLTQFFC